MHRRGVAQDDGAGVPLQLAVGEAASGQCWRLVHHGPCRKCPWLAHARARNAGLRGQHDIRQPTHTASGHWWRAERYMVRAIAEGYDHQVWQNAGHSRGRAYCLY